jgi:DNA-binding MurR/RpiR family transcriptional regulator
MTTIESEAIPVQDPVAISLDARLAARRGALSPTEQRVADFFAQHREEAAFLSATEIARRLGTSDATVVRTAQSLGYSGLQELKREFATTLRSHAPSTSRSGPPDNYETHPGHALDQAIAGQIERLEEMRRTVSPEAFTQAIDIIEKARRVLIFGVGLSATAAGYFVLGLMRSGRDALAITDTGIQLADALIGMRPDDAIVALASGRVTRELDMTLDHARDRGIPIILLTDLSGVALADRVAVCLRTQREAPGTSGSIATTLVLIDGLLMGLAARDPAGVLAARAEHENLSAKIAGYRLDTNDPMIR